jgi:hypothetical protein
MSRIPSHTIADAPAAARPLLQDMLQFSPTGRPLNLHAQLAHAPAVLAAYVGIRRATAQPGTLDQATRTALLVAAATVSESRYAQTILGTLAIRSGWRPDQVAALLAGKDLGEARADALIGVIREAAGHHGRVAEHTWAAALGEGWTDQQLAEAYGYLGLAVFTANFLNYADTDLDIPAVAAV